MRFYGRWEWPRHFLYQLGIVFTYLVRPICIATQKLTECFFVKIDYFLCKELTHVDKLLNYVNNAGMLS